MADRPSVGFIGVGNMGSPMASSLVHTDFTVHMDDARRVIAKNFVQ